ncbi:MAG: DUF3394 domain-containing protein, partial [Desulfosarcinaceae bacterium]
SLLDWEVALAMVATTLGLLAFAAAIERYFLRAATLLETFLFIVAAFGLLWPVAWVDSIGLAAFAGAIALQIFYKPAKQADF